MSSSKVITPHRDMLVSEASYPVTYLYHHRCRIIYVHCYRYTGYDLINSEVCRVRMPKGEDAHGTV